MEQRVIIENQQEHHHRHLCDTEDITTDAIPERSDAVLGDVRESIPPDPPLFNVGETAEGLGFFLPYPHDGRLMDLFPNIDVGGTGGTPLLCRGFLQQLRSSSMFSKKRGRPRFLKAS